MPKRVATFLMFTGQAEEAMNLYVSLFEGARIKSVEHYGTDDQGPPGFVKKALFKIGDHRLMCFDSPVPHEFTFTPAVSLFIQCTDEAELQKAYKELSTGGEILMPLDKYGFSSLFGWVNDRFGVSWQLNLD